MSHPWFANVDWAKIRSLDYEPPIKPKVASSYDTRYFDHQVRNQQPHSPSQQPHSPSQVPHSPSQLQQHSPSQLPQEFGSLVQSELTVHRGGEKEKLKFSIGMAMELQSSKESHEIVMTSHSVD